MCKSIVICHGTDVLYAQRGKLYLYVDGDLEKLNTNFQDILGKWLLLDLESKYQIIKNRKLDHNLVLGQNSGIGCTTSYFCVSMETFYTLDSFL